MARPKPAGYQVRRYRGGYAVVWYEGECRRRRSLGTADRSKAEARLGEFVRSREQEQRPNRMSVGAIVEHYKADKISTVSSPGAIIYAWKALKPTFNNLLPEHVTESMCKSYQELRASQGTKPGTARQELGVLQTALNWAVKNGWIDRAPHVFRPGIQPPRERYLTRDEFAKLLDGTVMPHIRLFLLLGLHTAGRMRAILDLTWDRVDLDRRLITLAAPSERKQKGRATVPIKDTLYSALMEAKRAKVSEYVVEWAGGPVKNIRKGVAEAGRRAGVKGVSPHVLRHTAATWMAEKKVDMEEIAKYLGHSDPAVTRRVYAKFSPDYLSDAADALE